MFNKKAVSEANVCRAIYDRQEVLQTQIFNLALEKFGGSNQDNLNDFKRNLSTLFAQSTDGLVGAVGKEFSVG